MSGERLLPVSQSGLSDTNKFAAIFRGYCAVDTESGAYMRASAGRSKWEPKYHLILPYTTPTQRGSFFKFDINFLRTTIRAWSEAEAIQIANEVRLPKLLRKLAKLQQQAQP